MDKTAEIVGGVDVRDIVEQGAVFEVTYCQKSEEEIEQDKQCELLLQEHLKFGCLDFGTTYDGTEPFTNIAKKMQNLLQNGKIKKRIMRNGYGPKPNPSSSVTIQYNAYVQYVAEPFDSTYARKKPFSFKIGEGDVIEGLDLAVQSMQINEKSEFLIESELAYRSGVLGRIPSDATVLFEVELCKVQECNPEEKPEANTKDFAHAYPLCLALSVKAKHMVKLKDYTGAIKEYKTAIQKLEEAVLNDYDDQLKSEELLVRMYTNLLVCNMHSQNPKHGCLCAQKIYEMAKNNTFKVSAKVYFIHAKCQRMLGGFGYAKKLLAQAKKLEPNNEEIRQEFAILEKEEAKYKKSEKLMSRALVGQ